MMADSRLLIADCCLLVTQHSSLVFDCLSLATCHLPLFLKRQFGGAEEAGTPA